MSSEEVITVCDTNPDSKYCTLYKSGGCMCSGAKNTSEEKVYVFTLIQIILFMFILIAIAVIATKMMCKCGKKEGLITGV